MTIQLEIHTINSLLSVQSNICTSDMSSKCPLATVFHPLFIFPLTLVLFGPFNIMRVTRSSQRVRARCVCVNCWCVCRSQMEYNYHELYSTHTHSRQPCRLQQQQQQQRAGLVNNRAFQPRLFCH